MKNIIITITAIIMVFSLEAQVNYQNNTVTGSHASALGSNNVSSGETSFVSGHNSEASGGYSTALGNTAVASGLHSVALGSFSTAQADGSVAIGSYAKTHLGADFSFAMGNLIETNSLGVLSSGLPQTII